MLACLFTLFVLSKLMLTHVSSSLLFSLSLPLLFLLCLLGFPPGHTSVSFSVPRTGFVNISPFLYISLVYSNTEPSNGFNPLDFVAAIDNLGTYERAEGDKVFCLFHFPVDICERMTSLFSSLLLSPSPPFSSLSLSHSHFSQACCQSYSGLQYWGITVHWDQGMLSLLAALSSLSLPSLRSLFSLLSFPSSLPFALAQNSKNNNSNHTHILARLTHITGRRASRDRTLRLLQSLRCHFGSRRIRSYVKYLHIFFSLRCCVSLIFFLFISCPLFFFSTH